MQTFWNESWWRAREVVLYIPEEHLFSLFVRGTLHQSQKLRKERTYGRLVRKRRVEGDRRFAGGGETKARMMFLWRPASSFDASVQLIPTSHTRYVPRRQSAPPSPKGYTGRARRPTVSRLVLTRQNAGWAKRRRPAKRGSVRCPREPC